MCIINFLKLFCPKIYCYFSSFLKSTKVAEYCLYIKISKFHRLSTLKERGVYKSFSILGWAFIGEGPLIESGRLLDKYGTLIFFFYKKLFYKKLGQNNKKLLGLHADVLRNNLRNLPYSPP